METLLIQYREFVILVGGVFFSCLLILFGYALGRNSVDKPVVSVKREPANIPPYHDDAPSIYDDALMDEEERLPTT